MRIVRAFVLRKLGMLCVGIYLILVGLHGVIGLRLGRLSILEPILALLAGILILFSG